MKAIIFTLTALIAFAGNSLLARLALAQGDIDPWNFTAIRLLSGAVCLVSILLLQRSRLKDNNEKLKQARGSKLSSVSLLVYALFFSVAYVELDTGVGALILFSAVQLTMISWAVVCKETFSVVQWMAFTAAFIGFVYLILPSASAPQIIPALLMMCSGIAWGVYSIRAKTCEVPLQATTFNFLRTLIALPILLIIGFASLSQISGQGVVLACISGALTSGIGYFIWYLALGLIKSSSAAIVQLCVPVLAAFAGILILDEPLTTRFVIASVIILTSVWVFLIAGSRLASH